MAASAYALARLRNLFAVSMLFGVFSFLAALLYVVWDAVDVAFTEAAVGAGISTVLMLSTLVLTTDKEKVHPKRPLAALILVTLTGATLVYGTLDMPRYGDPNAPINHYVALRYIEKSVPETGVPNVVTSVLASYRGYDTLGETSVIFTAAAGVLVLIGRRRRRRRSTERRKKSKPDSHSQTAIRAAEMDSGGALHGRRATDHGPMLRQSSVLRVIAKLLIPAILLFALYVQFHGDYGPGGGFQAGVIFAAAFILYALLFGVSAARKVVPAGVTRIFLALGVLLYAGTGIAAVIFGGNYLDYSFLSSDPVAGQELGIMLIEFGVGTTVASAMITIFFTFAGQRPSGRMMK
jgi:multicomponent Na+:H+ antiporter subunit B